MSNIVDAVTAFVEPVDKLIDAVQKGIGVAYEPRKIRKLADARAYEANVIAASLRDNCDVPIEYKGGQISMDSADIEEFLKRAQSRMGYQEVIKQANIESIFGKAYQMLENEPLVKDDPVSSDFINQFFDCVQNVSSEEMQELWARILAGEVKRPNSFSMRTLQTMHNMTVNEAENFQKLVPYILWLKEGAFIPNDQELLKMAGIKYDNILAAEECGLMNSSPTLSTVISVSAEGGTICRNKSYVITCELKDNGNANKTINIHQYPLTRAGREISTLCKVKDNDEFFFTFGKKLLLEKQNKGFAGKLHMYRIIDPKDISQDEMSVNDNKQDENERLYIDETIDYINK